jgi:hypothetical protein
MQNFLYCTNQSFVIKPFHQTYDRIQQKFNCYNFVVITLISIFSQISPKKFIVNFSTFVIHILLNI